MIGSESIPPDFKEAKLNCAVMREGKRDYVISVPEFLRGVGGRLINQGPLY